ncbi:hypothetical protein MKS88_003356 [Plasmodium brasilianum]|uniref:Uncharacterized protein n=2 Tax=Plasmodium (Plasmodium) TaxID=418103 RepID=A0A1A8WJR4_PLAMA|nr:conserved Plasmodium protein, unknown function [Plasmodium malariae]KAI4837936.1 hypothetical protein MKS88_003356 [Plasmodium brasilianum]SBS92075.1 conserved Plasmodium protein, unknown function [Plasmodium malariae]SCN45111.1 conserved Plasmodium protein, unknown function [Plasmodium malariae]
MNVNKKNSKHLSELTNEVDKELEQLTIQSSVYESCFLLLSAVQIYFLDKKTNKKINSESLEEIQVTKEKKQKKEKPATYTKLKNHFLNDYVIYQKGQKKAFLSGEATYLTPLYKKN